MKELLRGNLRVRSVSALGITALLIALSLIGPSVSAMAAGAPTANSDGSSFSSEESSRSDELAAELTGFVVVSGDTKVGSTLTATVEDPSEGAPLVYQWYRNDQPIEGANANTYVTTASDDGRDITCQVSAADYEGSLISGAIRPSSPVVLQAFAVYSEDDQSLNFYKRSQVPSEGELFAGKTATKVYTGIETDTYNYQTYPWRDYGTLILSATVVDNGIKPVSTACWFANFRNCTKIDLQRLDTSNVTSMYQMFSRCVVLTAIDVSGFDTSRVTDMTTMFGGCKALESLDISNFDTSQVTKMSSMFAQCESLTTLDISTLDVSSATRLDMMFHTCLNLVTIYSAPDTDWSKIPATTTTFYQDEKLIGGLGTAYDKSPTGNLRARVDGLDNRAGYFTPKITVSYFDPATETASDPVLYEYGIKADESDVEGFLGWALTPDAKEPAFKTGESITYDPNDVKDMVLYPVVRTHPETITVEYWAPYDMNYVDPEAGAFLERKVHEVTVPYDEYRFDSSVKPRLEGWFIDCWSIDPVFGFPIEEGWTADQLIEEYNYCIDPEWDGKESLWDGSSPIQVHATWSERHIKVNYDWMGNESGPSSTDYYWFSGLPGTTAISRIGWTFLGWSTEPDGGRFTDGRVNAADEPGEEMTAGELVLQMLEDDAEQFRQAGITDSEQVTEITLYARWEEIIYTVHYDSGCDQGVSDMIVSFNESIYKHVPDARQGYEFAGWFTKAGYRISEDFSYGSLVASDDVRDLTVYAHWTPVAEATNGS